MEIPPGNNGDREQRTLDYKVTIFVSIAFPLSALTQLSAKLDLELNLMELIWYLALNWENIISKNMNIYLPPI